MSGIPAEAVEAAAEAIQGTMAAAWGAAFAEDGARNLALTVLEAAEQAWPHEPPKRDLTGTTAGQFGLGPVRAPFRRDAQPPKPKVPFGFGTEVTA